MRGLRALVAVAITLAVPRMAFAEDWIIENLDFRLAIQPDTSIQATEALDVDFRGLERHGIFRDIVVLQTFDEKTNRRYDVDLDGVTNASGQRHEVDETREGAIRRFRIGDPDKTITGKQTYRITYRLRGAMNGFADHDELYWNATGKWPARIERAVIHVTAPAGSIDRAECFQGPEGSRQRCQALFTPDEATFTATRPLAAGEQMTIMAGLRKSSVAAPVPILVARPRNPFQFFDRTPLFLTLMLAGFAAAIGGIGTLWWRLGRDRQYTSIHHLTQNAEEEREPIFGSTSIAVEFEPPENIRPGQMGLLLDERADTLDVTATIVELAVRGYLKITELPKTGALAWLGKPDYQLDKLKDADAGLLEYERIVLDGLFATSVTGSQKKLSDLRNTFYKDLAKAKKALYKDAVDRGWFPQNPNTARTIWTVVGIFWAAAGTALTIYLGRNWGAGLVGLPVVVGGVLLLFASRAMPRRTAKGKEATRRALGFARYIQTAETQQQAFAERAQIFTAYLPYAIAMKAVDKWAKAFKDIDLQKATSGFYAGHGYSHFDAQSFSSSMSGFSSSVSSAIASTPGGSGGSGSGGSSGGGGGGGGGGSW
jgi:uncharacterized membrane protein YgcG